MIQDGWSAIARIFDKKKSICRKLMVVLVGIIAMMVPLLAIQRHAKRQEACADRVRELGGTVFFHNSWMKMPASLRRLSSAVVPRQVQAVSLVHCDVDDHDLPDLKNLTGLDSLILRGTKVTDKSAPRIGGLGKLKHLDMSLTQVTDESLVSIGRLTRLETLMLTSTSITDSGLDNLTGLRELQFLSVMDTGVTDSGKDRIKATLPKLHVVQ